MITLDSISAANASIEIQTAAGQALSIDGSGFITISNSSFAVTATQLDVDDLTFADDKVDASGSEVSLDAATLAALETTTVIATDLDIRDLVFATDKVDVSGSSVSTTPAAFDSWQTSVTSATSTAGEIAATPLASRLSITVQNLGNQDCYLGEDNTVTTSNGILLPKGSSMEQDFGAISNLWAITASGTADLRVAEYAA